MIRRQLDIFVALLRLTAVRIVLVLTIGIFVFNHAMNSWLPEILRTGGMSAAEAGVWASVPSLVGTIGPTMTGILADATGGFRVPLGTLTAVYLTCTMLVIALDRHQKRQLIG